LIVVAIRLFLYLKVVRIFPKGTSEFLNSQRSLVSSGFSRPTILWPFNTSTISMVVTSVTNFKAPITGQSTNSLSLSMVVQLLVLRIWTFYFTCHCNKCIYPFPQLSYFPITVENSSLHASYRTHTNNSYHDWKFLLVVNCSRWSIEILTLGAISTLASLKGISTSGATSTLAHRKEYQLKVEEPHI